MKLDLLTTAWSRLAEKLVSVAMALFFLCLMPNVAAAQTVTQYTNSTDSTPTDLIANARACSVAAAFQRDFVVTDNFVVSNVAIGVLVAHDFRGDMSMFLRSPAGDFVQFNGNTGGGADNYNVLVEDGGGPGLAGHTGNDTATATTSVPPYEENFSPSNSLNAAYAGQSSQGTWTLFICDNFAADDGFFFQADLFLTDTANVADLSLNKSVASGSPSTAVYTLAVTNSAASDLTATGVTVRDILPAGVSFASASGTGTYNSGTGIWTIGTSIAPGTSVSIDLNVNVTAASGTSITNTGEIITSDQTDLDSTPNNGAAGEDDIDSVTFEVGGRLPGIPPSIGAICTAAGASGTTILDWNSQSWVSGSTTGSANVANLGTVNFSVATDGSFNAPLALTLDNSGGFGSAGLSLFQSIEYTNITETTTTTVTLPTAVDGAQFTVFDVDFAANDFADRLQVTGSFNGGAQFNATLTNGQVNFISGNEAIGDGGADGNTDDGNVIATFSQPVDTITIIYGNAPTAPADPDGQAISIHDFTFCAPAASLNVTKISNVVSDGISASNPKAIPGAILRYCILISNAGSATANNISASDNLPADVSFVPGSMLSSDGCSGATTPEDDNVAGADETDPFGMSFAAGGANGSGVVTGTASALGPTDAFAMIFNVTLD